MLSFNAASPDGVSQHLARRFRSARLERGWSRIELGARAGVTVPTLRHFEDTGNISLGRLLKLASALGILGEFEKVATATPSPRSLAELEASEAAKKRQRGRTSTVAS